MFQRLCLLLALLGCKPEAPAPTDDSPEESPTESTPAPTVYELLGGESGIEALVQALLYEVAADDRINWMFGNADLGALAPLLEAQLCALTGGGCAYTGRAMDETHANMAITDAQFDAFLEDLLLALTNQGIPYSATFTGEHPADNLIVAVVAMRADIVRDPAGGDVLFNRLGGYSAVQNLVDAFVVRVAADQRISTFFGSTDLFRLNRLLVEQLCVATGGYCVYTGRTMTEAHAGMGVCPEHFDALLEDFLGALDEVGILYTPGTYDQGVGADELLQDLAGMRAEIEDCPT